MGRLKDEDGSGWPSCSGSRRTTNTAHWRYQPDAHGGTITALDDTAAQLVDPDFGRRGLAPVPTNPIYGPADFEQDHEHESAEPSDKPRFSIVLADNESHAPASEVTGEIEHDQPKVAPQQRR
ncbi:hypothetical protein GS584_17455 [Rhodococcus hoagii]|nr:hypothetical protein [Prescottella equi]